MALLTCGKPSEAGPCHRENGRGFAPAFFVSAARQKRDHYLRFGVFLFMCEASYYRQQAQKAKRLAGMVHQPDGRDALNRMARD